MRSLLCHLALDVLPPLLAAALLLYALESWQLGAMPGLSRLLVALGP